LDILVTFVFIVIETVILRACGITCSNIEEILMKLGRLQRFSDAVTYYCALISLLSIVSTFLMAQTPALAQSDVLQGNDSLNDLINQLEDLGGKAGQLGGQLGVGSAIDAARSDAVKGFARSPFSRPAEGGHPELRTKFSVGELLLIGRFCKSTQNIGDDQILGVMIEFSGIERDYCLRVAERIIQIGYDVFDGVLTPELLINGTIGDDYVLGIGDELVLSFEGNSNDSITIHVDREGRIVHKNIGRLLAAGRTFGQFRDDLRRLTEKTKFGTKVYVSMGSVRLLTVRVTGEVRKPGLHQITGLSSVFDAMSLAGGIKKTGSLRRIQVQRDDQIFWIDAYELIYPQFGGQDLVLRDGDHILVPAIGSTVAVAGNVKRPGIFELAEGQKTISVVEALELAGGPIRSKGNSYIKKTFDDSGREIVQVLTGQSEIFEDGDIVIVERRNNTTFGTVSIVGQVSSPGTKPLASAPSIRSLLLDGNNFRKNPYLLFAVLETTDPSTFARRFFPINLQEIVEGRRDYALRDKDRLIVFSQEEIRYLSSDEVRRILSEVAESAKQGEFSSKSDRVEEETGSLTAQLLQNINAGGALVGRPNGQQSPSAAVTDAAGNNNGAQDVIQYSCLGLRSLATILRFTRSGRFSSVVQALGGTGNVKFVNPRPCPEVFNNNPDLLPFVLEHSVAVNGEVRKPGAYPVLPGTPVSSLLAVVGGMTLDADTTRVEISRFGNGQVQRQNFDFTKSKMHEVSVNPGDVARFNPLFKARDTGPVLLSGEFVRPGLYDIRRGERLSELITRAGGITSQAYPYGSVFTRERVRVAEKAGFQRAARELKSAAMYSAGKAGANTTALLALQNLTDEIANTESVGRVVIEADPTVLQVRPELDTVLEPGDRIFMPKRPNSVLVIGDILNPGALQFISGTKVDEYVQQAGGLQISADEDRMFLVYPNGVAQPVSVSVWNYNPVQVPPGSTVVVPKDPVPINIFEFTKDMTALLSQMAITAASLAVIGSN
jgi:polysaccharide biosynthesis/export protein